MTEFRPAWMGLGGQRCGTGWLIANLREHPELCVPPEHVNFFHRDDKWSRGFDWYAERWTGCRAGQRHGEISSAYLYSDAARRRILSECPETKLFVCVRNPIVRTVSATRMAMQTGEIGRGTPLRQALRDYPDALELSRYYKYIARYIDDAGADRVRIFVTDFDGDAAGDRILTSVLDYLGVDTEFRSSFADVKVGSAFIPKSVFLDKAMIRIGKGMRNSFLAPLHWSIKASGLPDLIRGLNSSSGKSAASNPGSDDLEYIFNELREDIEALDRLVPEDLHGMWVEKTLAGALESA